MKSPARFPHFDLVVALPQVVAIADRCDGARSVTNGVEDVVAHLKPLLDGRRLIYRDNLGIWDEIVHDGNGHFTTFRPIGERELGAALRKMIARLVDLETMPVDGNS